MNWWIFPIILLSGVLGMSTIGQANALGDNYLWAFPKELNIDHDFEESTVESIRFDRDDVTLFIYPIKNETHSVKIPRLYIEAVVGDCGEKNLYVKIDNKPVEFEKLIQHKQITVSFPITTTNKKIEIGSSSLSLPIRCSELLKNYAPLEQLRLGIDLGDIVCKDSYSFIFKLKNTLPACVKNETVSKLIERGWAEMVREDNFSVYDLKFPGDVDQSCSTNSDCILDGLSVCPAFCDSGDVVMNIQTYENLRDWRELLGNNCPYSSCKPAGAGKKASCENNVCEIKTVTFCRNVCENMVILNQLPYILQEFEDQMSQYDFSLQDCDCSSYVKTAFDIGNQNYTDGISYCNSYFENSSNPDFDLKFCYFSTLSQNFTNHESCIQRISAGQPSNPDSLTPVCNISLNYEGLCDLIPDSNLKDLCFKGTARGLKDMSYCGKISSQETKDSCYNYQAYLFYDQDPDEFKEACLSVENPNAKENCKFLAMGLMKAFPDQGLLGLNFCNQYSDSNSNLMHCYKTFGINYSQVNLEETKKICKDLKNSKQTRGEWCFAGIAEGWIKQNFDLALEVMENVDDPFIKGAGYRFAAQNLATKDPTKAESVCELILEDVHEFSSKALCLKIVRDIGSRN